MAVFPLAPPEIKMAAAAVPDVHVAGDINSLTGVPAFDWSYGCSATSAAMLFGYYDRTGYSNMCIEATSNITPKLEVLAGAKPSRSSLPICSAIFVVADSTGMIQ